MRTRRGQDLAARSITAVFALFVLCAVAYGLVRVMRSGWLFFYTEGNVMASIGALLDAGSLAAMYPSDGWTTPPLVMTLYPPMYPLISGLLAVATGTETTLAMPRLVSLLAMGAAVAIVARIAMQRGVPAWIVVAPLGTLLLAPPFSNLLGAAQVDVLALCWTAFGIGLVLDADDLRPGRVWLALLFFLLAFYTKQSYVAAPLALVFALFLRGQRKHAFVCALALAAVGAGGLLMLDAVTRGGYLMNTAAALTGATSSANVLTTLGQSRPLQWLPAVLLLLLWAIPDRRLGVVELWVIGSWLLNVGAMIKVGASVNYLFEPLYAVMLLGVARSPAIARSTPERSRMPFAPPGARVAVTLAIVAWAAGATAPRAWQAAGVVRTMWGNDWNIRLAGFEEGYPLVDAQYVPAVRHERTLPYLNDTFAFGVLIEAGRWDAEPLLESLRDRAVPFILTDTDLRLGPRRDGAAPGEEGFAHFWRIPEVQKTIREHYELTSDASPWVWRPKTLLDGE